MGVKRALIVDDSKSARVFLARILEKYEIDVDNAENAEAAIEYLGHNRPDVIFMDHMMPGMDGFQAVQAIKNNPRTATIPIMMYTSQEGELYLGQARALGAVGVLPKQIKPTDVSKVLYQLHLVADRRSSQQTSFKQVNLEAVANDVEAIVAPGSIPLTDTALREQFAELRRALVASIDTQSERITSDTRMLLQDAMTNYAPPQRESRAPWVLASLALIVALGSAGLWWHEARARQNLEKQLTELQRAAEAPPAADAANAVASGEAAVTGEQAAGAGGTERAAGTGATPADDRRTLTIPVPYGDDALSGPRLEMLRQLLTRLAARDVQGTVEVRTFPGRYCLVGNATEGFSVAPDDLPFSRCGSVGNPHEDAAQSGPRESLGFANLANDIRASTHGALSVVLNSGDAAGTAVAYPAVTGGLTAGEWNRAAAANNRIEVRVR
jgi:CheY-like chemotaxis protein